MIPRVSDVPRRYFLTCSLYTLCTLAPWDLGAGLQVQLGHNTNGTWLEPSNRLYPIEYALCFELCGFPLCLGRCE